MFRGKREAEFLEHLEELRQRLIRCLIYIAAGTAATWTFRGTLISVLRAPLLAAAHQFDRNIEFLVLKPWEGFTLSITVAMVGGLILSFPLTFMEAWLFVEPALERHERKWVVPLLPMAFVLFCSGVGFCYWISPRIFSVLLKFNLILGVDLRFLLADYLGFILKLMIVFGVMFELPLILMFLSAVGVVSNEWLVRQWRIAIVVIAVVAAAVTPTPDAVTMSFLCGPMIGLYILSLGLSRLVDKKRREERAREREAAQATAEVSGNTPNPTSNIAEASRDAGQAAQEADGPVRRAEGASDSPADVTAATDEPQSQPPQQSGRSDEGTGAD